MASVATITIDMDKKCKVCGDKGSTPSGLCLKCITKKIGEGKAMQLKCVVKKVSTTKKEGGIDGVVSLSFIVDKGTIAQLHDLMEMQDEMAVVTFKRLQTKLNFDEKLKAPLG
jgi:hypothetical protein